jgi:magnesium transporter
MLRVFALSENKVVDCPAGDAPIMVFVAPDEDERRRLVGDFNIDEHTLTSSLDPDELARLEFEPDHAALVYKRPQNYDSEHAVAFRVASSGIFLFKDKLIIVQPQDIDLFTGKYFNRVHTLQEVLLKLIYRSLVHFLDHLKIINSISEELEQKINTAMENRFLISLFALEKSLVYYLNAINTNGVLLEKLRNNASKIGFNQLDMEYLDDLIVENSQCYRQAEIYSNILASLMDARVSIVSNNLNVLMKRLNIITIGIMVPTFVVSAFSMNVGIPLSHHPFAFWIIMGLAAVSVGGFMAFWRSNKL